MFHFAVCSISFVKIYIMNSEARRHDQKRLTFSLNSSKLTLHFRTLYTVDTFFFHRILAETVKELTVKRTVFPVFHRCIIVNCFEQITSQISISGWASVRDSHGLYIGWIRHSQCPKFNVFCFFVYVFFFFFSWSLTIFVRKSLIKTVQSRKEISWVLKYSIDRKTNIF